MLRARRLATSTSTVILLGAVLLSATVWLYLALGHGRYWRLSERLDEARQPTALPAGTAPSVAIIVPARNEAQTIERTATALLHQAYSGSVRLFVVDDSSADDTGALVKKLAEQHLNLHLLTTTPLPPGWVGKMWAVNTGLEAVGLQSPLAEDVDYVLLTDADLELHPNTLAHLVARAQASGDDLVSLMVYLTHGGGWPRLLIPAFVYFFQMLYPFAWVNKRTARTAGAAGGCMLVRRCALERIEGVTGIRDRLIDDCALAAKLKANGSIWLGLATHSQSIRPYETLESVWNTVARSAFVQLNRSWLALLGTTAGLLILYVLPLVVLGLQLVGAITFCVWGTVAAGFALAIQAITFRPITRFYSQPPWMALGLPIAGALYLAMTWDSALRDLRGRGVSWRGRVHHE